MNDRKIDPASFPSPEKSAAAWPDAINRRRVLRMAGAATGLVVIGGVAGCGGAGNAAPSGPTMVGNVSALAVGTMRVVGNFVVARDSGGVYAMSSICTHSGCTVGAPGPVTAGLSCPCHGSTYDANGAVTGGPAPSALPHFKVDIDATGAITADDTMPVAATTRAAVA